MPVLTKINTNALSDSAVTSAKVATDALGATDIAAGAVGSSEIATDAVTASELANDAVDTAAIATGAVTAAKVAADVATQAELDTVKTRSTILEDNVAMLGFFRASDDSKAKYNLVDQVIDQFQDATGIDAGASTAEVHDNTNKFYCATTGVVGPTHLEGTGSHQTFTVPTGVSSLTFHIFGAQVNGLGGYTTGTLATSAGTVFTIVVGTAAPGVSGYSAYGYGGGGRAYNAGGGGGLSGLFTGSSSIASDAFDTSAVQGRAVLVAGGAGSRSGAGGATPGSGGGASGTSGNGPAGFGTQSAGGAGSGGGEAGVYMEGGDTTTDAERGAGGGGYFGGGGHNAQSGGGGGSGYIGGGTLSGSISSAATYVGASSEKTSHAYYNLATAGIAAGRVSIDYDTRVFANMTLQSVATTAESAPTKGDIVVLIEDNAGTATVQTDIKAFISRDGSAFTSQVTLVDEGDWGTNKRILTAHDVDLSGITSGTAMKYKITTHNQAIGKETRIHAVSLAWS